VGVPEERKINEKCYNAWLLIRAVYAELYKSKAMCKLTMLLQLFLSYIGPYGDD